MVKGCAALSRRACSFRRSTLNDRVLFPLLTNQGRNSKCTTRLKSSALNDKVEEGRKSKDENGGELIEPWKRRSPGAVRIYRTHSGARDYAD